MRPYLQKTSILNFSWTKLKTIIPLSLLLSLSHSVKRLSNLGFSIDTEKESSSTTNRRKTMMSSSSTHLILSLLFISVAAILCPIHATDHIVGANRGWNPGINYTLWANNHTFYVGDLISFRYLKNQYNVFEVNQTGYDNCTTEGAVGNWSSGKDFISLNDAKRYYFICGNGQCYNGMKVSVLVHPLPLPPSALVSPSNSSSHSAAPVTQRQRGLGILIVSFAISLLGSGWM